MTSLELFAFVILPVGVAASAWAVVLLAERRATAKSGPRDESAKASAAAAAARAGERSGLRRR